MFFTGYPLYLEAAFMLFCLGLVLSLTVAFSGAGKNDDRDSMRDFTMWTGGLISALGIGMLIYIVLTQNTGSFDAPLARTLFNGVWVLVILVGAVCIYEFNEMRGRLRVDAE